MATDTTPWSDVGRRIEARRAELGLTKDQLQKALHTNPNTYGRMLSADPGNISLKLFQKLADELKSPLAYLLSGEPAYAVPTEPPGVHNKLDRIIALLEPKATGKPRELALIEAPSRMQPMIRIPVRQQIAAGGGALSRPMRVDEDWIPVPAELRTPGSELIAHQIIGDSMEPELTEGDLIIVEYPTRQPARKLLKHGALVVVVTRGSGEEYENLVKHYVFDNESGRDVLLSLNPEHGHIPVPKDIVYVGLVRQIIKGE